MIGGILLHPNFVAMVGAAKEAGTGISVFGLPITLASYGSSVLPIGIWNKTRCSIKRRQWTRNDNPHWIRHS